MAKKLAKRKTAVAKVAKKVTASKKLAPISKSFTKTEILEAVASTTEIPKKKVSELLERIHEVIVAHIKKGVAFSIPGMLKIHVVTKPATKSRQGINPFTGEPITIKAKPARKVVKIKPLKKLKAAV